MHRRISSKKINLAGAGDRFIGKSGMISNFFLKFPHAALHDPNLTGLHSHRSFCTRVLSLFDLFPVVSVVLS